MILGVYGYSVRILIFVGCLAITAEGWCDAAAGTQFHPAGDAESSTGEVAQDLLPLDLTIMSDINASALADMLGDTELYLDLDQEQDALDLSMDPSLPSGADKQVAALLTAYSLTAYSAQFQGEVAPLDLAAMSEQSTDDARLTLQFAVIYGAICLLAAFWGMTTEVVTSRRQEIANVSTVEKRLDVLVTDSGSRSEDDHSLLADIERHLAEHQKDMESLKTADVVKPQPAVTAAPE